MLHVWGCTAYVLVQKDKRPLGSLGSHMEKCVFIGYPAGYKAWKFYCPESKKVLISERADFDERHFINQRHSTPQIPPPRPESLLEPSPPSIHLPDLFDDASEPPNHSQLPVHGGDGPIGSEQPPVRSQSPPSPIMFHTAPMSSSSSTSSSSSDPDPPPVPAPIAAPAPSRPQRQRRPREQWYSEQWAVPQRYRQMRNPEPAVPSSDEEDASDDPLDLIQANSALAAEPTSYRQSQQRSDKDLWHKACEEEMEAHRLNGTWEIVKLPPGQRAIGSRWFMKVKTNADGSLDRYKARMVAKGYSQRPGFDFKETFAPTVRYSTIRIILAIAALEDLELRSLDISHAYLNGELEEEIYMRQPEGFEVGGPEYVCRLKKSLYGLKQAGRVWNKKLHSVLLVVYNLLFYCAKAST